MPTYSIKNQSFLKKILWLDALMDMVVGLLGMVFTKAAASLLGFSQSFVWAISAITFFYGCYALVLALQKNTKVKMLRILVYANWQWTIISVFFLYTHFGSALLFGKLFLILSIPIAGTLAYIEGSQIVKSPKSE
jgi:hypothetical protein